MKKGGNPQNLKPFKPGESGNPNGRPKKLPAIDKLLANTLGSEDDKESAAERIIQALIKKAEKGDTRAAEILLDRGYGKPKQTIDIPGEVIKGFIIQAPSAKDAGSK